MEYNEKRKKVILKKINDFNFQKLNNVENLLKKEISFINPIINETRTLLFYNTEFSDWYISKSESLVLQLEQGNKEPYLFCFVEKQVINNTFFGTKKINKLFYEMYSVGSIKREKQVILNSFLNLTKNERDFLDYLSSLDKMVDESMKSLQKEYSEKISQKQKKVKEIKTNILNEFDKDGNGVIDVIEGGDDFMKLFRKHQTLIKDFDKNYINHLVKISNYLKTKRNNIQDIFLEIRKTKNQLQLDENLGLLKNQIHTYEVVLFHSLSMITSIVEDDLITVNEIYEEFDKLKMFKTDHEKEVSQKLSDIGNGLSNLMYSINTMERNILSGLNTLSYVTQEGFVDLNRSLTKELKSINSTIDSGNLLSLISTYQLYKINKQTKGLIE
tara:strand:- start:75 stop:1232 length:1158 start_codon:yes stop_codon:yes gene_type:complete